MSGAVQRKRVKSIVFSSTDKATLLQNPTSHHISLTSNVTLCRSESKIRTSPAAQPDVIDLADESHDEYSVATELGDSLATGSMNCFTNETVDLLLEESSNDEEHTVLNFFGDQVACAQAINAFDEQTWKERYDELIAYKGQHGSCDVPYSSNGLGRWVCCQCRTWKNGKLSSDQIKKLHAIGFVFIPKGSYKKRWTNRYKELVEYKKLKGTCDVTSVDNKQLSRWVKHQRTMHKEQKLSISLRPLDSFAERVKSSG
jgi:hypothetical protein